MNSGDPSISHPVVRLAISVAAALLLVGLIALFGFSVGTLLTWAVCVALTAAGLFVFFRTTGARSRRSILLGENSLLAQLRASTDGVSDVQAKARIGAMAEAFQKAVDVYRQIGRNLTDPELPWYLVLGVSGSGKSEAIRKSGIKRAPGLNNELAGIGGTINMDWWFTESGVLLDTAGRLVVARDESAASSEFEKLLQLLRSVRPDYPINGVILVLPADDLQRDSLNKTETTATAIASRLQSVQRSLGVRFPIWVMITKSDLIPGFKDFFARFSTPQEQAQIIGWSNSQSLDQDFDLAAIDVPLNEVRAALIDRRATVMQKAIEAHGDLQTARLAELDTLFALPEALTDIAPNLQRYLTKLFTRSKFAGDPLFFRGLYFTQAREEGVAFDSAVAQLMGLTLEEFRVRENVTKREKAMFLTDVFEQKVFIERGLVTTRQNPDRIPMRTHSILVAVAAVAALCVLGAGFAAKSQLAQNVGETQAFWEALNRKYVEEKGRPNFDMIERIDNGEAGGVSYIQNDRLLTSRKFDVGPTQLFTVETFERFGERDLRVPWLFKPFERLIGTRDAAGNVRVGGDRAARLEALYRTHVLRPLITETARTLADPAAAQGWGALQDDALIELVHLALPDTADPNARAAKLEPLLRLLANGRPRAFSADEISRLETLQRHLFDARPAAQRVDDETGEIDHLLADAISRFVSVHEEKFAAADPVIDGAVTLKTLLAARSDDERLLEFAKRQRPVASTAELQTLVHDWSDLWNSDAQAALAALPETGDIVERYKAARTRSLADIASLTAQIATDPDGSGAPAAKGFPLSRARLADIPSSPEIWQQRTAAGDRTTVASLEEIRRYFGLDSSATGEIDERRAFYKSIDGCLKNAIERLHQAESGDALSAAPPQISPPSKRGTSADATSALQDRVEKFLLQPALRTVELREKLAHMRKTSQAYRDDIAKLKDTVRPLEVPDLGNDPEVAFWFKPPVVRPEFDPKLWEAYRAGLPSTDTLKNEPILDRQSIADALQEASAQRGVYLKDACAYWSNWLQGQEASADWASQPWSVIVDHFAHADVNKLSDLARQLILVQQDALDSFARDDADADYSKQITALKGMRDTLSGPNFLKDCRAALKTWAALGPDARSACQALLASATPSQLDVLYPSSDETFWFRAFLQATDTLSQASPPVPAAQAAEWLKASDRFPFRLSATGQPVEPWVEPKELATIVANLLKLAPAAALGESQINPKVKAALDKLAATSDPAVRTAAAEVLAYAAFADAFATRGQVEIWQLPGKQSAPGGIGGASYFALADVGATKTKAGADLATDPGTAARRITVWKHDDRPIVFDFTTEDAKQNLRTIQAFTDWLDKPLRPVALLATAEKEIARPGGGKIYVVAVNAGTAQQPLLWKIGISFVDSTGALLPVPDPKRWPRTRE